MVGVGRHKRKLKPEHRRLGAAAAKVREAAGLSRPQLAKKLDIDVSIVCRTENGEVALSLERAVAWCKACGAAPDCLVHAAA